MADPKDPLAGLGDLDWDAALDEWEKTSFVAEVAKDKESTKAVDAPSSHALKAATGQGTLIAPVPSELREEASKPITSPPLPRASAPPPRGSAPPPRASAPPPRASAPPPRIASQPRLSPVPPQAGSASAKRGGLGQLFSKRPPPPLTPPPRPAALNSLFEEGVDDEEVTKVGESLEQTKESAALDEPDTITKSGASSAPTGSETLVIAQRHESMSDADTQTRLPADDEAPTIGRPSVHPISAAMPAAERPTKAPAAEPSSFEEEKPVSKWLDADTTASFRQRAVWLEEEAREEADATKRARMLLTVSEIRALVGDTERALELAVESRDGAPAFALAWRQARQLTPRDTGTLVASLDAEAQRSPTPAARAHATLLAADVMRTTVDVNGAFPRWESAGKLDPADARAPVARAAMALARGEYTSGALVLAGNSELLPLDRALGIALRMRGAPRPGDDAEGRVSDGLRRTRTAFAAGDVVAASQALADMGGADELGKGALWLSAALGATHVASRRSSAKSLKILAAEGEILAKKQLAARGIELADPDLVTAALADETPLDLADHAALLALSGQDALSVTGALAKREELAPLLDALSATSPSSDTEERARRAAGNPDSRALASLGRHLAGKAKAELVEGALAALAPPRPPSAAGVALEAAIRARRWNEIIDALSALPGEGPLKHVAAALVAERAQSTDDARRAWREALVEGATQESIARIASKLDPDVDLAEKLREIADDMPEGVGAAILRLEVVARKPGSDDEDLLDRAHRAAPKIGIAAFLAERLARRRGDLDVVLRWIAERRSYGTDALETALDSVREALLVADRDPEQASERLAEAHRARPDDVALRELYERLATDPPTDRGEWREKRAATATGQARAQLFTEAAYEHERAGDPAAALRCAEQAAATEDKELALLVLTRAEVETGKTERQTEELLELAKTTEDPVARREAYERLAEIDAYGKKDRAAAVLWHRTILDETPHHKPSLRWVEQALIGDGSREEELEPIFERITRALDGSTGGEVTGHAQHATRFVLRGGGSWERTKDVVRIAATQPEPSLWALRASNAHARLEKDDEKLLSTTLQLLERTQRPPERATLLLRASEAAARLERVEEARSHLEGAAMEDPGDVVTWGFLAEVRQRSAETRAAAEACESLARASVVKPHQLLAWNDAAKLWLDEVNDSDRGMSALEQAAEIDVGHADIFTRLSTLYAEKKLDAELARLLEKRLAECTDEGERAVLEVDLARALAEMGEIARAKKALEAALDQRPDHTTALSAMAELCVKESDWNGAEQAYVRLARLLATPEEQCAVYDKLGDIYSGPALNLSRAEVAYKEVLKRAPKDPIALAKLVDVYKRQGDVSRAVETQQVIIGEATDPKERLERLIELAGIYEVAHDARRAEQVLDGARKEFPTSVVALRAMAQFYARQRQMPAMQILLDRAAGDARRSFAAGRFVPALFEVLHAAFELRGKKDAARVVAATLAAVEGQPSDLRGADAHAIDPRLDDVLAPEIVSASMRTLLYSVGDALDAASPIDLGKTRATPLVPGSPIGPAVGAVATVVGLGALQIMVSPTIGKAVIPLSSNPPLVLVGEEIGRVVNPRARMFLVVRALKMVLARASSLLRNDPKDVGAIATGLFMALNPTYQPSGVDMARVREWGRRIHPALPRNLDPTVGVLALEAAGMLGPQVQSLGAGAIAWANRTALLAVGDPNGALDAIAWTSGLDAAPTASEERAAWIARTPEARELMTFSVSEAYAEARARIGLDR